MQHTHAFLELVREAKSQIEETNVLEVKARLDTGEELILVDVREESEWDMGRIPGAIHLSKGIIERDIERVLTDRDKELIIYCGGGYRSALVAVNLRKMGYKRPVSMDGGIRGWMEAGLPVYID